MTTQPCTRPVQTVDVHRPAKPAWAGLFVEPDLPAEDLAADTEADEAPSWAHTPAPRARTRSTR